MLKLHERCVKNVLCAMNCEWILTIEFTGISIQKVRLSKAIIQSNSEHIDSANLKWLLEYPLFILWYQPMADGVTLPK